MNPARICIAGALAFALTSAVASAADYPAPKEGDWVARDFRFHTGEVMPELRLHYRTLGNPSGEPALLLHGTGGWGASFLTPAFAGELFGSGQPLDASKYLIILPDAIGTGKSAKPSDGLRTTFPKYNYDDMVEAQYRLVTEGLGIRHRASCSAIPWAACTRGFGAKNIPTSWTPWCPWRRSPRPWRAAIGCCGG